MEYLRAISSPPPSPPGSPAGSGAFLRRPGYLLLLGTNVVGDAFIFGRATIFRSQRRWLDQVRQFVRGRSSPDLVIRIHPAEALTFAKVRLGPVAEEMRAGAPNILVIHAEEPINTHALVRLAVAGLVWTSTLGVDVIDAGKALLVAAAAPYSQAGVGVVAPSIAEYSASSNRSTNPPTADPAMCQRVRWYRWLVAEKLTFNATGVDFASFRYRVERVLEHPGAREFFAAATGAS
jgi:hypothetical protein